MSKKIVLITGGSSGLGFELIKILLDKNYNIINLSKTEPKINSNNLFHIKTNLNCNKSIQRTIDQINNSFSKLDFIFLNAGIWKFEMIEEINFRKVDEIMKVNFSSNIKLISGLNKLIRLSKTQIIISGSINYKSPEVNQITYNVSKSAMKGFTDSLKLEFEEDNIQIKYLELNDFKSNLVPEEIEGIKLKTAKSVAKKIIKKLEF